jgi:probable rRNA maturation factor
MRSLIRFAGAPVKNFPNRNILRSCLAQTALAYGFRKFSLQYVFLNDEELLEINQEFLGHDELTDIITFNMADQENEIEGEIYISKERVLENAETLGLPAEQEFCRVIAHGLLHLCGLKDKNPDQAELMRKAEDKFLNLFYPSKSREE